VHGVISGGPAQVKCDRRHQVTTASQFESQFRSVCESSESWSQRLMMGSFSDGVKGRRLITASVMSDRESSSAASSLFESSFDCNSAFSIL
jgi:hypothetical protein